MRLSAFQWFSGAIALPLFFNILNTATPVAAEPANLSKQSDRVDNSLVTSLNLTVPVEAKIATARGSSATVKPSLQPSSVKPKAKISNRRSSPLVLPTISVDDEPVPHVKNNSTTAVNLSLTNTSTNRRPATILKHRSGKLSHGSLGGNYMRLVREPNRGTNELGNPIYTLETYIDGALDRRFKTVSGTTRSQQADRNIGNNHAPLPDGLYAVSNWVSPSNIREVDGTFISIFPQFKTNRTELGIHRDPSFNKSNGYDGTSGCIGMTTDEDRDAINNFVTKYRPHKLLVDIAPM
jgi:hypothetical protein